MIKLWILITIIFLVSFISASCEEGQIDINSASAEELDEIYGIGPVKAQAIIDTRPYNSLDDLIKVSGIGEVTLSNIISQNLVCVEEEPEEEIEESKIENTIEEKEIAFSPEEIGLETINLNPKAIKSGENSEFLDKRNYSWYGLVVFVILLGLLFFIKTRKDKNEFK